MSLFCQDCLPYRFQIHRKLRLAKALTYSFGAPLNHVGCVCFDSLLPIHSSVTHRNKRLDVTLSI